MTIILGLTYVTLHSLPVGPGPQVGSQWMYCMPHRDSNTGLMQPHFYGLAKGESLIGGDIALMSFRQYYILRVNQQVSYPTPNATHC